MRLQDQVIMIKLGDSPLHIFTESIRFEPDRGTITSESSILIQTSNARIEAEQAIFDLDSEVYSFKKARGIYYDSDG